MDDTKVFIHEILDRWQSHTRTPRESALRRHRCSLPEQCREDYDKMLTKILDVEDAIFHIITYQDDDGEKQLALNLVREIRSQDSFRLRVFLSPTLLDVPSKILTKILTKLPTTTDLTNAMETCEKLHEAGEDICLGLKHIDMAEAGLGEETIKKHLDKNSPILTIQHVFQHNAKGLPSLVRSILDDPTVMSNVSTLVFERCLLHFSETNSFTLTLRKVCMIDCILQKWPKPSVVRQLGFLQLTPTEDFRGLHSGTNFESILALSSKFVLRADAVRHLPCKKLILDGTKHTLSLGEVTSENDAVVIPHEFVLEKGDGTLERRYFAFGPAANHQTLWEHLCPSHKGAYVDNLFRPPSLWPDHFGLFPGFAGECEEIMRPQQLQQRERLELIRREVLLNRVVITYKLSQNPTSDSLVTIKHQKTPHTDLVVREDRPCHGIDTHRDLGFKNQVAIVKQYLRSKQVEREDLPLHKKTIRILDDAIRNSSNALKLCSLPKEILVCILSKLQSQRDLDAASKVSVELKRAASMTKMQLNCIDMSPQAILNLQDLKDRHVPTTIRTCRIKNYRQSKKTLPEPLKKLLRFDLTKLKHLVFENCHQLATFSIPADCIRNVDHITFDDCHLMYMDSTILCQIKNITVKRLKYPFQYGFESLFDASLSLLPAHKSIWTMGILPEKRIWWDNDEQQLQLACDGPWPQGTPIVVPHELQLLSRDGHGVAYANSFAVGAGEAPERLISCVDSRLLDEDCRPEAPLAQMVHMKVFKRFKEECFDGMKNVLGEENFRPDRMIVKREVLEDRVLITCKLIS